MGGLLTVTIEGMRLCAPATQVVKGSTKHSENQNLNKFKKKLELRPRCPKVSTQNGLSSVSPQLSCPAVKTENLSPFPQAS